jgi:hypothetical protein
VSREYVPESIDPRDAVPESVSGPRQTGRSDSSREQGPGSDAQDDARITPERAPKTETERHVERRKAYEFRSRTYTVRSSEIESLTEIGKFRAVASEDLEEFQYDGDKDRMRPDVASLIRQGLIVEKSIPHSDTAFSPTANFNQEGPSISSVNRDGPWQIKPPITASRNRAKPITTPTSIASIKRPPKRLTGKAARIRALSSTSN